MSNQIAFNSWQKRGKKKLRQDHSGLQFEATGKGGEVWPQECGAAALCWQAGSREVNAGAQPTDFLLSLGPQPMKWYHHS